VASFAFWYYVYLIYLKNSEWDILTGRKLRGMSLSLYNALLSVKKNLWGLNFPDLWKSIFFPLSPEKNRFSLAFLCLSESVHLVVMTTTNIHPQSALKSRSSPKLVKDGYFLLMIMPHFFCIVNHDPMPSLEFFFANHFALAS
jgi:hypothetical protein